MSATFACGTCYDTRTIDFGGAEITCPSCDPFPAADSIESAPTVRIKITGLGHSLGETGTLYSTAATYTPSTITFAGTKHDIRADVARVRSHLDREARLAGHRGRNHISSGAIAIERRVLAKLILIPNRKQNQS